MKTKHYLLPIAAIVFLFGCGQGGQKAETKSFIPKDFKLGKHCYVARFEKDSANLSFDIGASGKINGALYIGYGEITPPATEREIDSGGVTGEFKGDTIFLDYQFKSGKSMYNNPVALLLRGDSLTLGSGKVMNYLGRTYFDPATPIDFIKSRFRFKAVECKK